MPLANPNGILPDQNERLQRPRWYFENYTEAKLIQLLRTCDLRPAQRSILFDKQFWTITSNACIITPPEPVIWSLSSHARGVLYSALATSQSNYAQCFPFRLPTEGLETYLKESGLSETDVYKIKRLAYTNAGAVCFTDLQTVHEILKPEEFEDLVGALYKVPAYTLRLHVPSDAKVETLIKYWGKGGRAKIITPLLKGLARVPGGGAINVASLLPPFARIRLYTFPDSWNDPSAPRQDCFYTSMNFFSETPNTNFFDRDFTRHALKTDFVAIEGTPEFGDLILVLDDKGAAIHMCVYLADDFVYTKNGINHTEPWVIMRMSDMLAVYSGPQNAGKTMIFRSKSEIPADEGPGS